MWKRCNCLKLLYLFVLLGATKYVAKITHQGSHKSCFSNKGNVLSMFGRLLLHLFFINNKYQKNIIVNTKRKSHGPPSFNYLSNEFFLSKKRSTARKFENSMSA
jgi:hypothetical protein